MLRKLTPEQAQYFFEKSDDAVCVISASGDLLFSNPSTEKILGISAEDDIKIWDAIPYVKGNDDLIQLFIDAVAQKLTSQDAIVDYVSNEGKIFHLHVRITFHKSGDIPVYLIVITDLTKLRKVSTAFARYTTKDIADYVLETEEGQKLAGSTQNVTILMSDLRGFTALSSKLPAHDLITVLNHYFETMVAVIEKHHGTLIEFLGDGILVVFGAPKAYEDHAAQAVKCAVEMENAIKAVNEWNNARGYPGIGMGIGINSGDVVVGNIGSEKAMKYGCIGQTVNIAGRLEGLTVGGQILITANTKDMISEDLDIVSEDTFLPKGADVMSFYDVCGIGDLRLDNRSGGTDPVNDVNEECTFFFLEAKKVSDTENKCVILKRSSDGRYALMASETEIPVRSDIMLMKQGVRSYAKVIRKEDDGYLICITAE